MLSNPLRLLLPILVAGMTACSEIGPEITPVDDYNTVPSDTLQRVFIEEFSGVRCVNCPAGSAELAQLEALYPDQLVIMSIHAGFFSSPYPENRFDFRTGEGNALLNLLKQPLGYPSAVINRRLFEGEADLQLSRTQWAGFIAAELKRRAAYNLEIETTYLTANRQLRVDVRASRLDPIGASPMDLRMSVFLTESDIRDVQLTPAGKQVDYAHQHVLRKALTPYDGVPVGEALIGQSSVVRSFSLGMPEDWSPGECEIVAVLHRSGEEWTVLQANARKLVQ